MLARARPLSWAVGESQSPKLECWGELDLQAEQQGRVRWAPELATGASRDVEESRNTRESHPPALTKAFTLVGGTVHKDFGRDDIAERQEHLRELRVPELLGQVINKQVTALGTWVTHKGQPHVSREAEATPGASSHRPHGRVSPATPHLLAAAAG